MSLLSSPRLQYLDADGVPLPSAKASFYLSGTSTPAVVYTDALLTTAHPASITQDGTGYFPAIYVNPDNGDLKLILTDSIGANSRTIDPVTQENYILTVGSITALLNPTTDAELAASITPDSDAYPVGDARRYGADPTGVNDSTEALQRWINATWSMYYYPDSQGKWNGGGGAMPVLTLPPGKYRLSDTLYLPTGTTTRGYARPSYTTNHTRLIMDSTATVPGGGGGDNRNKPIFKFRRGTLPTGGSLANQYFNSTIQDIEFEYVTLGNDFNNPLGGAGIPYNDYPLGGAASFDVDAVDTYFIGCSFQHTPAAFRVTGVPASSSTRGDGFTGNAGVYAVFIECEFDAGSAHVHAKNSHVDLEFRVCRFYGGRHQYEGCTGRVVYDAGCRFFGNTFIDADDAANDFDKFEVHGEGDLCTTATTISIANAEAVEIDMMLGGASGTSAIALYDCDAPKVHCNIQGSGYNASAGTGLADYVAAIKALGCRNGLFTGNVIQVDANGGGTYNGFGILLGDSGGRTSTGNLVAANSVTAPYNGSTFNSQNRFINITSSDRKGRNLTQPASTNYVIDGAAGQEIAVLTYSASITPDATKQINQVTASNATAFAVNAPTNPAPYQEIAIQIRNASGGALGVATWNAAYKMAAWTQPGNGASRTIRFYWDTTNWVEMFRTPADVPN